MWHCTLFGDPSSQAQDDGESSYLSFKESFYLFVYHINILFLTLDDSLHYLNIYCTITIYLSFCANSRTIHAGFPATTENFGTS